MEGLESIDNANHCVFCGVDIPEGVMACKGCVEKLGERGHRASMIDEWAGLDMSDEEFVDLEEGEEDGTDNDL